MNSSTLLDLCEKSPKSSGLSAIFCKIDEVWGFKYYEDKQMRDNTHRMQKHAAKHNLAPKVGKKTSFTDADGFKMYGYFTEMVQEVLSSISHSCHMTDGDNNVEWDYYGLPNITSKLKEIGFTVVQDLHDDNVGYLNGNLVCFDFSECEL